MSLNTVAEPGLRQSLEAEALAEGEDWRDWAFGQLDAVTQDWQLAEVLDQAIVEGQATMR
jgi:hypothetical protein